MPLIDLSDDLLAVLVEFIPPRDLISYVSSCRRFLEVAETRLKRHRALRDRYSHIWFPGGGPRDPQGLVHPFDMIAIIDTEPWTAEYVYQAAFTPNDFEHAEPTDYASATGFFGPAETEAKLHEMEKPPMSLIHYIGISDVQRDEWQTAIDKGGHSASFAILLTLLPNLRRLELTGWSNVYKPFLDPVFRHACAERPKEILSKLQTLQIQSWDNECGERIEALDESILVPSLRKLHAHLIGDEGDNEYTFQGSHDKSNLEEVDITYSHLGPLDLAEILKPMTSLRKLDYESVFSWDAYGYEVGKDDFEKRFAEAAGKMLTDRGLVWKVSGGEGDEDGTVKIRKAELAHEMEDM